MFANFTTAICNWPCTGILYTNVCNLHYDTIAVNDTPDSFRFELLAIHDPSNGSNFSTKGADFNMEFRYMVNPIFKSGMCVSGGLACKASRMERHFFPDYVLN